MRLRRITCLGLFLVCAAALAAPAQVAPIGAPFEIASSIDFLTAPLLAVRPDGTYLVVWKAQRPSGRVLYGRLIGPSGAPVSHPFDIALGEVASPAVAVLPDGGFVVVWEQGGEIRGSAHDRDGQVRLSRFQVAPKKPKALPVELAIAAGLDGGWMVVWQENPLPLGSSKVFGRWFASDGRPGAPSLPLASELWDDYEVHPRVATRPDGGFLTVWIRLVPPMITGPYLLESQARLFDSAGLATGSETSPPSGLPAPGLFPLPGDDGFVLAESSTSHIVLALQRLDAEGNDLDSELFIEVPSLLQQFALRRSFAIDPTGRLLLVGTNQGSSVHHGQLYDAARLEPLGAPFELPTAKRGQSQPYLASAQPGQFLMVWEDKGKLLGEILAVGCAAPHLGLCLAQNRFRVEVSWRDHQGNAGKGHAVPLKDDTGAFWFFAPSNPELLVKILDGRRINGHYWVFYGSLSDVEFDIVITDMVNGNSQRYHNPAGTLASRADVEAFTPETGPPPGPPPVSVVARPGRVQRTGPAPIAPFECLSSEMALCLDPLYRVTIDFVDPETGATRHARAVPFSLESGAFWFFDPNNLELFVKVLDGSAINGHAWVFHGALTDLEYTLTVDDSKGSVWTYHNPRGRMHSGADTSAIPLPPPF